MSVAVVTIVHGRGDHLRGQHASLARGGVPDHYVVAAMGDSTVRARHPAARPPDVVEVTAQAGDAAARGGPQRGGVPGAGAEGTDVLVFLDVDCSPGRRWCGSTPAPPATVPTCSGRDRSPTFLCRRPGRVPARRAGRPRRPAPRTAGPAPGERRLGGDPDLFWSLSFAIHADGWRRSGGFCESYVGYGAEDTDFAASATSAGLTLGWLEGARLPAPPVVVAASAAPRGHPAQRGALPPAVGPGGRWAGWLSSRLGLVEREDGEWRLTPAGRVAARA